jgi:hypothetical protein
MALNQTKVFLLACSYKLAIAFVLTNVCISEVNGQFIPKFNKSRGDTLALFSSMPVVVVINLGQSDPTLVSLRSEEINSYMISKFDDSTYVINLNRVIGDSKLKLYYKGLPVDIFTCTMKTIESPKIVLKDMNLEIDKGILTSKTVIDCDLESFYKSKYRVSLHSFNIKATYPNGRSEIMSNNSLQINGHNLTRLKSLPAESVIQFDNIRLRTIYNNVIEVRGSSDNYTIKG